jgi:hypothetical protein
VATRVLVTTVEREGAGCGVRLAPVTARRQPAVPDNKQGSERGDVLDDVAMARRSEGASQAVILRR